MTYYVHDLNPMAISLGWFILPWYWLAYICGFFSVYFGFFSLKKKGDVTFGHKFIHSFLSRGFLILILGGRVGYILFYNLSYYLNHPAKIFALWEGGMSFHGAIIGIGLYALICSRKEGVSLFKLTDPICLFAPLGIFFGRMANFMNGELAGRATDVSWAVIFPKFYDNIPRHPSQIYEALLEGLLIFLVMQIFVRNKLSRVGFSSGIFLVLYGIGRFFVEFFRNPDPQIGLFFELLTLGQFLCLAMIIIGLIIIANSLKKTTPVERQPL
ncbi:prolipoprotein diacylglyceryl transferase [Halobacteriovorax sp. HLS]|uniref:prolipoprotein diacylglyceryl transferase n=1 Tax=Halobacteriovorax sp. HLS TaxID=2234000 RepID=UPI000FD8520D|nr:prolipoprotein diacylglyceryl transferase [Halobacteriovorax sp. HLS]